MTEKNRKTQNTRCLSATAETGQKRKCGEITREEIIDAAFEELRENGWQKWNARSIAKRVGCSTMPLFRLFSGMDEIKSAVVQKALCRYGEYIAEGMQEPLAYRGSGKAYIRFAREEPHLFKALCATKEFTGASFAALDPTIDSVLAAAAKYGEVDDGTAKRLHACMTVFCHGAAVMAATGADIVPERYFDELMGDVFRALRQYYKAADDKGGEN